MYATSCHTWRATVKVLWGTRAWEWRRRAKQCVDGSNASHSYPPKPSHYKTQHLKVQHAHINYDWTNFGVTGQALKSGIELIYMIGPPLLKTSSLCFRVKNCPKSPNSLSFTLKIQAKGHYCMANSHVLLSCHTDFTRNHVGVPIMGLHHCYKLPPHYMV